MNNTESTRSRAAFALLALTIFAGTFLVVLPQEAQAAPAVCAICVCSEDPVGQLRDCIGPIGFCSNPQVGVYVGSRSVCVNKPTVTTCPSGTVGAKVNGVGSCQALPSIYVCPSPSLGAKVNGVGTCQPRPNVYVCQSPTVGAKVDGIGACVMRPDVFICASGGYYGVYVNGVGACSNVPALGGCPSGRVGFTWNGAFYCFRPPSITSCPAGTYGVHVDDVGACQAPPGVVVCPDPYMGVTVGGFGTCFDRPDIEVCSGGSIGARVEGAGACVPPPTFTPCPGGTYGGKVNNVGACEEVEGCPPGSYGGYLNDNGTCYTPGYTGPCPAGQVGYQVNSVNGCRTPCPSNEVGLEPTCVEPGVGGGGGEPVVPAVNCPTVAGKTCPPLVASRPTSALVIYDGPSGELMLGHSATGATFSVLVVGLPGNARQVYLWGNGNVVGVQQVDRKLDGSTNGAVRFDNVLAVPTNDYRVSVVDDSNAYIADSGTLPLWGNARDFITVPGDGSGPSEGADEAGPSSPEEPSSPDGPDSTSSACTPAYKGTTWATEGNWEGVHTDLHGNNPTTVDEGPMVTMAYARPWAWGGIDGCGNKWEYRPGTDYWWGVGKELTGKANLVGTGTGIYGFALTYAGGGSEFERYCNGLHCQMVGYTITAQNARSFMQTPPATVLPEWRGTHNVNIPSTTGSSVPSALVNTALNGLSYLLGGWGGAVADALGFAVPGSFEAKTYEEITTGSGGIQGGGLNVNTPTDDQKLVAGEHQWRFRDYNSFAWTVQVGVDMEAHFHACNGCNWVESSYTSWANVQRNAAVTRQPS